MLIVIWVALKIMKISPLSLLLQSFYHPAFTKWKLKVCIC